MKSQSYMTRALRARDPRFARILGRLGYAAPEMTLEAAPSAVPLQASEPPAAGADRSASASSADPLDHDGDGTKGGSKPAEQSEELSALRAEYQAVLNKRPFHGWDAETLKAKIAEAKA
jgi:hypothetical protein